MKETKTKLISFRFNEDEVKALNRCASVFGVTGTEVIKRGLALVEEKIMEFESFRSSKYKVSVYNNNGIIKETESNLQEIKEKVSAEYNEDFSDYVMKNLIKTEQIEFGSEDYRYKIQRIS